MCVCDTRTRICIIFALLYINVKMYEKCNCIFIVCYKCFCNVVLNQLCLHIFRCLATSPFAVLRQLGGEWRSAVLWFSDLSGLPLAPVPVCIQQFFQYSFFLYVYALHSCSMIVMYVSMHLFVPNF